MYCCFIGGRVCLTYRGVILHYKYAGTRYRTRELLRCQLNGFERAIRDGKAEFLVGVPVVRAGGMPGLLIASDVTVVQLQLNIVFFLFYTIVFIT